MTLSGASIMEAQSLESEFIRWFGDEMEKRTDGLIRCEYVYSSALTKPGEEIDAVRTGILDYSLISGNYYPSKPHLNNFSHAVYEGAFAVLQI